MNCEYPIVGIVWTFHTVWEVRVGGVSPIHEGAVMVRRFGSASLKPEINCPFIDTKSFSVHWGNSIHIHTCVSCIKCVCVMTACQCNMRCKVYKAKLNDILLYCLHAVCHMYAFTSTVCIHYLLMCGPWQNAPVPTEFTAATFPVTELEVEERSGWMFIVWLQTPSQLLLVFAS